MIKMIAFDLDGTLISHDGKISNKVIQSFKKLKELGIILVPTTGRTIHSVINIAKILDIYEDNYLGIFNTGAAIQELNSSKLIYSQSLSIKDYLSIKDNLNNKYFLSVYTHEYIYLEEDPIEELLQDNENLQMEIKKLDIKKELPISRINIMGKKEILDKFKPNSFFDKYYLVRNIPTSIEIINKNTSKGEAVKYLANRYNISLDEVLCIGDGNNDISMLKLVKYSVAMGNASDEVKKYAKFITDSVEKDGFVKILEKLNILKKS